MSKYLSIVITIIAFLFLVSFQYCAEEMRTTRLEQQIATLANSISVLQSTIPDTSKGTITPLKAESLELKIRSLKQDLEEVESDMRADFGNLLKFGLPVTLIALITFFLSLYKFVYDQALEKAKEAIDKKFTSEEQLIKEEKNILVIHHPEADQKEMQDYLVANQFAQVEHAKSNKLENFNLAAYQLLLFNSKNNNRNTPELHFSEDEIGKYIEQADKNAMFFSYNGPFLKTFTQDERVSSANFKSQIVPNLLNLLKYQNSRDKMRGKNPFKNNLSIA